jgi:hypothetical protein
MASVKSSTASSETKRRLKGLVLSTANLEELREAPVDGPAHVHNEEEGRGRSKPDVIVAQRALREAALRWAKIRSSSAVE